MDFLTVIFLVAGGIICAVVNVIGGGGSLIALPILLALGLPAGVANGTNRVAILFQDTTSLITFQRNKALPWREGFRIAVPVVIGAVVGALVAARVLDETLMNICVLVLVVFMIAALFYQPDKWLKTSGLSIQYHMSPADFILFLVIGFYGGFIQAGFTYLIMAALVLKVGNSVVQSDSVKILLNMLITPFALIVFLLHHQVDWRYGLLMGIGGAIGGILGTRFATRWNPSLTRIVLIILLVLSALYILFFRIFKV